MGQYTILMNNNTKRLVATNRISLRQFEELVDKLVFIYEFNYSQDIDLRDFNVSLYWVDESKTAHVDILTKEEEIYKEKYQRCFIPVDSLLNKFAGKLEMYLVFTKVDYETKKRYKLQTYPIIVEISPIEKYYQVIPNESFNAIENMIDELQAKIDELTADAEVFATTKADNHIINEDGRLTLTANGVPIGNALDVAVIEKPDNEDEIIDGIIDISGKYDDIEL